jgi:hypothetical protein
VWCVGLELGLGLGLGLGCRGHEDAPHALDPLSEEFGAVARGHACPAIAEAFIKRHHRVLQEDAHTCAQRRLLFVVCETLKHSVDNLCMCACVCMCV